MFLYAHYSVSACTYLIVCESWISEENVKCHGNLSESVRLRRIRFLTIGRLLQKVAPETRDSFVVC